MNVIEIYDKLHAIPEEGLKEYKTSEFLANELEKLGYQVQRHVGVTGVVGTFATGKPGPTVAVRADMDALKHVIDGQTVCVHSCGHDAHSSMALVAAAELIKTVKHGTLKIVFQPGEETLVGALSMIEDGVLDDIDIMYGLHLRPIHEAAAGKAVPGLYHAASVVLDVVISGKTAHGARPHLGLSAIDAGALVVLAVNSIKTNPVIPCSIKVTGFNAGGVASNAIPDKAKLVLDIRAQTNDAMKENLEKIHAAIANAAQANGCTAEIINRGGVPAAELDEELTDELAETIKEVLGKDGLLPRVLTPGGEDFHYFAQKKPGLKTAYFGLGCDLKPGLHDPGMFFDKNCLQNGVKIIIAAVNKKLG